MKKSSLAIGIGRIALVLSFVSLVGAWIAQLTGSSFFGESQQHLFSDATVLALIGIAGLVDGIIHQKEETK